MSNTIKCDMAVLGSGPGGYTAAFRAADLGKQVVLIEKHKTIGGVCLNVGCIPSKTLLHASEVISEVKEAAAYGLKYAEPEIDIDKLRNKKNDVVAKLTGGLGSLAKARKVQIIEGIGKFRNSREITVSSTNNPADETIISFEHAVIAVGSRPVTLPFLPLNDDRIWNSTDALNIPFIPRHLAVLGGGIIGLEMAEVYASLGSKITIIEMMNQIIPPADADMVRNLAARLKKEYEGVYTSTRVTSVEAKKEGLTIVMEGEKAPEAIQADALLTAVGRRPMGKDIGAEEIGITVDEHGFIKVDSQLRTSLPHIFAVGDVTGNPMLAHKAVHEGKTAAEVISGMKSAFAPMTIPSVAYTNPEIAWAGYTEKQAKEEGIPYEKGVFPWAASGRALSAGKTAGSTKALFHKETGRLIGLGINGARAEDLLAEGVLAMEMGADAKDIASSIHAHPTFSETLAFAAEMANGTITDALPPKKSDSRKK